MFAFERFILMITYVLFQLAHSDITMETLKQSNLDQATKIENYIQKLKDVCMSGIFVLFFNDNIT